MEYTISVFGIAVVFMMYVLFWWTPFMCAQQNKNKKQIFWLTIFLGWIPLVWFGLLLAALLGDKVPAGKSKR